MAEEKKYNINVNRASPSKEDIKHYRDFGKLISTHRNVTKLPLYKRKRTFLLVLLVLLVLFVLYLAEKETKKDDLKGLPQKEQSH